jgi:hypothetical protein
MAKVAKVPEGLKIDQHAVVKKYFLRLAKPSRAHHPRLFSRNWQAYPRSASSEHRSAMKSAISILFMIVALLGYRVLTLEAELKQISRNTAIAVLSIEAANDKIGAIAPYFSADKEKFAKAWIDSANMPLAVFPEDILIPLKRELEEKRTSKEAEQLKATILK